MNTFKSSYLVSRFLPILMVFGVFVFEGCSNEPVDLNGMPGAVDPPVIDPPENEALIINNWDLKDVQLKDATAQFEVAGNKLPPDPVTGMGSEYDLQLKFNEDSTVTSTGSYVQTVTVQFGLQAIDESRPITAADFLGSGTWSLTDTTLTIDNGTEVAAIDILELTEESLILQLETTQSDVINGVPVTLKGTIVATFSPVGS